MLSNLALFLIEKAQAAPPALGPTGTPNLTPDGSGVGSAIGTIFDKIIIILTLVAGFLAVLYLIWSGIQYITSAGNPDKAKVARQGIVNAIYGIVIIVAAYAIIRLGIAIANTINGAL